MYRHVFGPEGFNPTTEDVKRMTVGTPGRLDVIAMVVSGALGDRETSTDEGIKAYRDAEETDPRGSDGDGEEDDQGMKLKEGFIDTDDPSTYADASAEARKRVDADSGEFDDPLDGFTDTDLLHTLEEQGYHHQRVNQLTLGELDRTLVGVERERIRKEHNRKQNQAERQSNQNDGRMDQGNRSSSGNW